MEIINTKHNTMLIPPFFEEDNVALVVLYSCLPQKFRKIMTVKIINNENNLL